MLLMRECKNNLSSKLLSLPFFPSFRQCKCLHMTFTGLFVVRYWLTVDLLDKKLWL